MNGRALALAAAGALAIAGAGAAAAVVVARGYVNGQAYDVELTPIDDRGNLLRADAAAAWFPMARAAALAGVELVVNRSFATWEQQAALYALFQAGKGAVAAAPGYSHHQGGVALDIESAGGTNAAFRWLTLNAAAFGWTRTVQSEPWHWELA